MGLQLSPVIAGDGIGAGGSVPLHFFDDMNLSFGNTSVAPDVIQQWDTTQTNDAFVTQLSGSNNWIVTGNSNITSSRNLGLGNSVGPNFVITSNTSWTTATDQWLSLSHNAINGMITTGVGSLTLQGFTGTTYLLKATDIVTIDAATTPHTSGNVVFHDVHVNASSVNAIGIDLDVSTALLNAQTVNGINIDIDGLAGDNANSNMNGIRLTSTNATGGSNIAINIGGAWNTGIFISGATNLLDLVVNTVGYANNYGVINLSRLGNFTGIDTQTAIELNILPTFTLTEPGAGQFDFYGVNIDLSGIAVTLGAGTTLLAALRLVANADADAGTNYALFVDAGMSRFDGLLSWETTAIGTGTAIRNTQYQIGRDADATNQLHFNVPTGTSFEFSVNDVPAALVYSNIFYAPIFASLSGTTLVRSDVTDGGGAQTAVRLYSNTVFTNPASKLFALKNGVAGSDLFYVDMAGVAVGASFQIPAVATYGASTLVDVVREYGTANGLRLRGNMGNVASAYGVKIGVTTVLTDPTAKIVGFFNDTGTFTVEKAAIDLNGKGIFTNGSIQIKRAITNIAGTVPTDAELDAAFGDPTVVGSGFLGILDDNDDGILNFVCWTTGTAGEWFYGQGTKAL